MVRFNWVAVAAVAIASVAAACSDGADTEQRKPYVGSSTRSDTSSTGNVAEPATDGTTPTNSAAPEPSGTAAPAPGTSTAGPGSAKSPAHAFFSASVHPKIAACGACHNTGANNAPTMLAAAADAAYLALDTRGLIVPNSSLLTKGVHFNGGAPALSADAATAVSAWLAMEAKERAGTPTQGNPFAKIGACLTQTDFEAVRTAMANVQTVRRNGENANNCTGCNNTPCRDCHAQSEYGFLASNQVLQPSATYFAQWIQREDFVKTYIGANGATLVPSTKVTGKATLVAAGKPYSHPNFRLPAALTTAITTFANNAITKFNAKQCGQ
jgi:hypothetical protein